MFYWETRPWCVLWTFFFLGWLVKAWGSLCNRILCDFCVGCVRFCICECICVNECHSLPLLRVWECLCTYPPHLLSPQIKCDQYWPSRGTETYGMTQVTLLDTIELATFCVRTFSLHKVRVSTQLYSTHTESNSTRCRAASHTVEYCTHGQNIPHYTTQFQLHYIWNQTPYILHSTPKYPHCTLYHSSPDCYIHTTP